MTKSTAPSSDPNTSTAGPGEDTPTLPPSGPTAPTNGPATCSQALDAPTASTGPASVLVSVEVLAPATARVGDTATISTFLAVHTSGPRIVTSPSRSAVLLLRDGAVVAESRGTPGPSVPAPLEAGARLPAQTVPTQIVLVGCSGAALDPGTYTLRAVVGYGNDPLNGAAGDGGGSFVLVSPPATVVVS